MLKVIVTTNIDDLLFQEVWSFESKQEANEFMDSQKQMPFVVNIILHDGEILPSYQ